MFVHCSVGTKRYTPDHEYVHLTAANAVTIGISNHAQEALGDVVFVDLPDVGAEFKQRKHLAVLSQSRPHPLCMLQLISKSRQQTKN